MVFGVLGGDSSILQIVLSFVMLGVFFLLFPKIILFQIMYKLKSAMDQLEINAQEAEMTFLEEATDVSPSKVKDAVDSMKNMVVSPPSNLDPSGMFEKMEHVLDSSDDKIKEFVRSIKPESGSEERANNAMAFKGVYGAHQIFVVMRHFKKLIEETKNYQLGGMIQMMLPVYKELSESQKDATEAFVNEVPIGDTIGPMISARMMESEGEEIAEDIVYSKEEIDGGECIVVKSKGPGSRLGKYGNAVEKLVEEEEVAKILTVDAGMRYEGEETGTVVDGSGVLMGGPGVEKGKIEEVATENDVPLHGYIVKQSGPEASRPMHKKIWDAQEEVINNLKDEVRNTDGTVMIVGVGNTCGAGNHKESLKGLKKKLRPYWKEQEEEVTSYLGLMKAFPGMGIFTGMSGGSGYQETENTFRLFQKVAR
ncbi:MAG: DUF1512 family protein [Candidatus Nanohaloarchaea archaeon]|nr:DUF1512 family protein [Candidatus Nanohaloarchaea archaeon]